MNFKRLIPSPLRSRLERLASFLRTAIRDRRALERDLDAAWETHDEQQQLLEQVRKLLRQSETRRAELLIERTNLQTSLVAKQAELHAALQENHSLKIRYSGDGQTAQAS